MKHAVRPATLLMKPEIITDIIVAIDKMNDTGFYDFYYERREIGENSELTISSGKPEDFIALGAATAAAMKNYINK